ncbi:hypothetical protein [Rathayibacter soli]|uniref:hypothetical protein n=1 Tax=Rathayibacter soli TaxID=3144168 RepID=UPI0027E53B82|nr:hypothetical protein [Glaciibacter superstes]
MTANLRRGRGVLAIAVVGALTVAVLLPNSTDAAAAANYPDDGAAVPVSVVGGVPARDSQLGHGPSLMAGIPESIDLGAGSEFAHSALVRLSLFNAELETTLSVAGAPALSVAATHSASTTVLVPVRDGALTLTSSANSDVRVEVVAVFSGDRTAPGATVALDQAVSRPDAPENVIALAAEQPLPIGLLGLGGVPVSAVRAVHVSLTVTAERDATVSIDGQNLPIAEGISTLSTIVLPSSSGDVTVASDAAVRVSLDVRGYVAEAAEYPTALNGPGAYWPAPAGRASQYEVTDAKSAPVALNATRDAAYAIALVWAGPAQDLTVLEFGEDYRGRARGGVVDEITGAQPQLAVVPATDSQLTLRRGATQAHVLELGSLLGDSPQGTSEGMIRVDSPAQGTLNLGDRVMFSFEGVVDTGDVTPLRVEVTRNGETHGSASIVPGSTEHHWSFVSSISESGDYEYEFTAVARDGSRSSAHWSGTVTIPGADAFILQSDAVIMGGAGHDARVLGVTDNAISFGADPQLVPGQVIVAGVSDGAPAGYLRRVTAIDLVNGTWQGMAKQDDDHTIEPGDPGVGEITELRTLPLDELDLAPLPEQSEPTSVDDEIKIDSVEPISRALPSFSGGGGGGRFPMALPVPKPLDPTEPAAGGALPGGGGGTGGGSIQGPELGDSFKHTFKEEGKAGGYSYKLDLTGELSYALSLTFQLDIGFDWKDGSWWPPIPPLPDVSLKKFSTILESTAKATVNGKMEFKAQWKKELKGPKFDKKFEPITFAIGPVPVVITTAVKIELKASVSVSAVFAANFSSSVQAVSRKGFRLGADGKFVEVNEAKFTYKEPTMGKNSGLSGSASAQAGPEIAVSAKLYDAAGPSVGASLMAGLSVAAKATPSGSVVDVELYLSGEAFVKVAVTVPVIDYKLLEATLFEGKFKWKIIEWNWKYADLFDTVPGKDPDPGPGGGDGGDPGGDGGGETDPGGGDPGPGGDPGEPGGIDAMEFAQQIGLSGAELIGAAWVEGPPHPSSVEIIDIDLPGMGAGKKGVLSTGSANSIGTGNSELGGVFNVASERGPDVFDVTTLRLDLRLPDARMCLSSLYFALMTEEDPHPRYNDNDDLVFQHRDFFLAQWDGNDWFQSGNEIFAPHSISYFGDDGPTGTEKGVIDTTAANSYWGGPYAYQSGSMATEFPVTSGDHSLYLTVADFGGSAGDTTAVIDYIQFRELWGAEECGQGTTWAR